MIAKLEGNVQGVVVHTNNYVFGSSTSGKVDRQRRIIDFFIIQIGFKIGKRRSKLAEKGITLNPSYTRPLLVQLAKYPPDRFHERQIHRAVCIIENRPIGPSALQSFPTLPYSAKQCCGTLH